MGAMKEASLAQPRGHKDGWFELLGDNELRAAIDELTAQVGPQVMLKAIRKGLPIAKREAKSLVKKRSGALRRAIGSRAKWNKKKHLAWGMLRIMNNKKITYNGRPHDPNKIAHLVEYGTTTRVTKSGANRGFVPKGFGFMRRALSNKRRQIMQAISREAFIQHEKIARKATSKAKRKGRRR